MANRVLRDTTDSEKVNALSNGAEVFFYRLFMKADDHGIHPAHPLLLKSALFPLKSYDPSDIISWMDECIGQELVIKYRIDHKDFIKVVNFGQRLRNMRVKYPLPPTNSNPRTIDSESPPETKRNETETEITTTKIFFRVRSNPVLISLSEYIPKNFPVFLESWLMKNGKELLTPTLAYMETKYAGYLFSDENHIQNSFTVSWDKIKKDPQLQKSTPSFFAKKPITNG